MPGKKDRYKQNGAVNKRATNKLPLGEQGKTLPPRSGLPVDNAPSPIKDMEKVNLHAAGIRAIARGITG